jgi:methionine-rich copper-binding protein CopC
MFKNFMVVSMSVGFALASVDVARAHAHLHLSDPAKEAVTSISPPELTLHFTEALEIPLCKIDLKNALSGEVVKLSKPTQLENDPKSLRVVVMDKSLKNDVYKVNWKVVSTDGHKMQGDYQFTVKVKIEKK